MELQDDIERGCELTSFPVTRACRTESRLQSKIAAWFGPKIDSAVRHYIQTYCNFAVVRRIPGPSAILVPKPFASPIQIQMLIQVIGQDGKGAITWRRSSQLAIFEPIEKPLIKVRQDYLSGVLHFPHLIPFLGAVDFLEVTARTFDKCDQFRGLELETYSGDYAF